MTFQNSNTTSRHLIARAIDRSHWDEWRASGVDSQIIEKNVKSLEPDTALDYLLCSPKLPRENSGRVSSSILRRYNEISSRGWFCGSVDPQTGEMNLWGQVKFDRPRVNSLGKAIKYESPAMMNAEIYCLAVPESLACRIAGEPVDNIWQWAIEHGRDCPLYITEGAKKAGSLLSRGKLAIALPGINSGYRNEEGVKRLTSTLSLLSKVGREIIFAFDRNENAKTTKAVNKAIFETARLFKKQGCKTTYLNWKTHKGIDDFLVSQGDLEAIVRSRLPTAALAVSLYRELPLNNITHTVNCEWLSSEIELETIDADANIIGIKSAKGTGKTQWLARLNSQSPYKSLVISSRRKLAREIGRRLNLPYRTDKQADLSLGYSLCIDSLHKDANPKFQPDDWAGAFIFIDEVEQVIWHLLDSSTCRRKRAKIILTFQKLLKTVLSTGGKLIVADSDLSSVSMDFLTGLVGDRSSTIIVNNYSPLKKETELYNYSQSNPNLFFQDLCAKLNQREKIILISGAAKIESLYSTKTLLRFFSLLFPQLKIGKLDSEDVLETSAEEYLTRFDLAIVSPAIEAGISIDSTHFDSVWCLAQGTQSPNGLAQSLARVRNNVKRYLWCNHCGITKIGGGETCASLIATTSEAKASENARLLGRINSAGDEADAPAFSLSLSTWARLAAWHNYQSHYYRYFVLAKLASEYKVINVKDPQDPPPNFRELIDRSRQENIATYIDKIVNLDLNNSKGVEIKDLKYRSYLEQTYGKQNITPELVKKDRAGFLSKWRLHFDLLSRDRSLIDREQHLVADYMVVDRARCLTADRKMVLEKFNIYAFLNPSNEFTSSGLESWFERLCSYRRDLKRYFGFSFGDSEQPIKVAQRLLNFFLGIKLKFVGKRGKRGKQERYYCGYCLSNNRASLFAEWFGSQDSLIRG